MDPAKENHEEAFILTNLKRGDVKIFEYVFKKYYASICRFIDLYIHNHEVAEEIAGDLFVYLWKKRKELRIHSLRGYLFTAAKNRALNHIRDSGQISLVPLQQKETGEIPEEDLPDDRELLQLIDMAIESLPPKCRTLFKAYMQRKHTYKEIAARYQVSPKTVENQIGIALQKIREFIRRYHKELF